MGTSYKSVEELRSKHEMVRLSSVKTEEPPTGPRAGGTGEEAVDFTGAQKPGLLRGEVIEIVGSWDHRRNEPIVRDTA